MKFPKLSARSMLATAVLASFIAIAASTSTRADELKKVSLVEVVHHIFFSPLYLADALGYFKDEGIRVEYTASQGGDKAMAALLSGSFDIALAGPETAIYVDGSQSPTKVKMFCGLTASDGTFLVSRSDKPFDWKELKGKSIITWRTGSTPALFLEEALRRHGLDPAKDVNLISNIGIPARLGAFLSGQGDYGTFFEVDVSKLEQEKKGFAVASLGQVVGPIDYTAFIATDAFIAKNPEVLRGWTRAVGRGLKWIAQATPADAVKLLAPYFPGVSVDLLQSAVERQRKAGLWKSTPDITPASVDAMQALQIAGGILKENQKVPYDALVTRQFFDAGAK